MKHTRHPRRSPAVADFATRWRSAGAALEDQRRRELAALDPRSARKATGVLFALWKPGLASDDGVGLIRVQRRFRRLRAQRR